MESRFSAQPWADLGLKITLIGVGGTGSNVALALGRIGYDMEIMDGDNIARHNTKTQMFGASQVGQRKVMAMRDNMRELGCEGVISAHRWHYTSGKVRPVCIAAVDTMEIRRVIFKYWKAEGDRMILVDPRMMGEFYQVHFVIPGREEWYETTLFDDDEVTEGACGLRQVPHVTMGITLDIVSGILNQGVNLKEGKVIRALPYRVSWNGRLMKREVLWKPDMVIT